VNTQLRLRNTTWQLMQSDLSRPHAHASERVGFLTCGVASGTDGQLLVLEAAWHPVDDADYLVDHTVGAHIGPSAFRKMLQLAYSKPVAILHVHRHDHRGLPWFSRVDLDSLHQFIPDFWNVRPELPHGALVLSLDAAAGLLWLPRAPAPTRIGRIDKVGVPLCRWDSP
jgi:hypothetical protein